MKVAPTAPAEDLDAVRAPVATAEPKKRAAEEEEVHDVAPAKKKKSM